MNIKGINMEGIKSTVKSLPSGALKEVNKIGETTINCAKAVGSTISAATPESAKNIKTPDFIIKVANYIKEHTKNIKAPNWVEGAAITAKNFVKEHKETFAGAAVIVAAVACAASIIKAVVNKIQETKAQK